MPDDSNRDFIGSVQRTIDNDHSLRAAFRAMKPVPGTPFIAGEFIGDPISLAIANIVRGLHWFIFDRYLPLDLPLKVGRQRLSVWSELIAVAARDKVPSRAGSIAAGQFQFAMVANDEHPAHDAIWLLRFHGVTVYSVMAGEHGTRLDRLDEDSPTIGDVDEEL